jgi:hypothetical protein
MGRIDDLLDMSKTDDLLAVGEMDDLLAMVVMISTDVKNHEHIPFMVKLNAALSQRLDHGGSVALKVFRGALIMVEGYDIWAMFNIISSSILIRTVENISQTMESI